MCFTLDYAQRLITQQFCVQLPPKTVDNEAVKPREYSNPRTNSSYIQKIFVKKLTDNFTSINFISDFACCYLSNVFAVIAIAK